MRADYRKTFEYRLQTNTLPLKRPPLVAPKTLNQHYYTPSKAMPQQKYLKTQGLLTGDWVYVYKGFWQFFYEWMCRQMEKRGIPCQNNPPVWAFHSCGGFIRP